MQQLLLQQTEADDLVSKLQQERDFERNKLINDILKGIILLFVEQISTNLIQMFTYLI